MNRLEDENNRFQKGRAYDLSSETKKFALVKDVFVYGRILPRQEDSYIVPWGVKKYRNGKYDLYGLASYVDEADLQSQFSERVHPVPRFKYEIVSHANKDFGIIVIPPERVGPCVPIRDLW